mmetsp:Transcript_28828/g.68830  ORF Transcript_28828/g.68830 Transcript_28828/m.68830 type:complete len:214 (+) Transcript_28828:341-982(+)
MVFCGCESILGHGSSESQAWRKIRVLADCSLEPEAAGGVLMAMAMGKGSAPHGVRSDSAPSADAQMLSAALGAYCFSSNGAGRCNPSILVQPMGGELVDFVGNEAHTVGTVGSALELGIVVAGEETSSQPMEGSDPEKLASSCMLRAKTAFSSRSFLLGRPRLRFGPSCTTGPREPAGRPSLRGRPRGLLGRFGSRRGCILGRPRGRLARSNT